MATKESSASDSFFYNQALYGRYRIPTLIVIVAAIAWTLQPVAIYYALEIDVRTNLQNAAATAGMIHFIAPFFLWLYFWVAFTLLSHLFGARMRVGRLFKLTGWGIAPFVLISLVRAAGNYYAYQGAELSVGVIMGRFSSEWNAYQTLLSDHTGDPLIVSATAISCVFLLLSGYIWMSVIKFSTTLEDRKKIAMIVAIPTIIYVVYSFWNVLV